MITLTRRQRDILLYLLKQEHYTTYNQCAETFGVSNRSVRNDIQCVEAFLSENGCQLIKKSGLGVKIQCDESRRSDLKREMSSRKNRTFHRKERQYIAILVLLLKENCTFQEIADICYVSKQTIINGFLDIQKELAQDELVVEKISGVGLRLVGEELLIRRKFIQMVTPDDSISWVQEIIEEVHEFQTVEKEAEDILSQMWEQCGISFVNQRRIQYILCYFLIRSGKGHHLPEQMAGYNRLSVNNSEAVLEILKKYFKEETEQIYVFTILFGERMEQTWQKEIAEEEEDEASRIAMYLVESLQQLNQFEVEQPEMVKGLTFHLRSAIYRYHNHIHIQNEMLDEIKLSIPLMYEYTKKKLREIEGSCHLEFEENEIAYIAMYIASIYETSIKEKTTLKILIVCSFGLATSSILKTRILSVLPDCDILEPVSHKQAVEFLENSQVDVIIATNEFEYGDIPVISVNPLLSSHDIDKIKDYLYQYSYSKMCRQFIKSSLENNETDRGKYYLKDYVEEENIQIADKCKSWEEAIQLAAAPLLEKNLIFQSYVNSMIWAVKEFGTYMVLTPKTAYVHAGIEDGVQKNCVSMLVLKHPVEFGDVNPKTVSNIVVLGIRNKEKNNLLNLAYILEKENNINLLENEKTDIKQILEMHD